MSAECEKCSQWAEERQKRDGAKNNNQPSITSNNNNNAENDMIDNNAASAGAHTDNNYDNNNTSEDSKFAEKKSTINDTDSNQVQNIKEVTVLANRMLNDDNESNSNPNNPTNDNNESNNNNINSIYYSDNNNNNPDATANTPTIQTLVKTQGVKKIRADKLSEDQKQEDTDKGSESTQCIKCKENINAIDSDPEGLCTACVNAVVVATNKRKSPEESDKGEKAIEEEISKKKAKQTELPHNVDNMGE